MPHYLIVAIYVGLSFFIALLGMNRKWGFWGYFFGSLLLNPLIGILLVLASDPRRREKT
jgi:hypothetical protein